VKVDSIRNSYALGLPIMGHLLPILKVNSTVLYVRMYSIYVSDNVFSSSCKLKSTMCTTSDAKSVISLTVKEVNKYK